MNNLKISGSEIIRSIPGRELLIYAITKLFLEGKTRDEITDMFPTMTWDVFCSIDFKSLPQDIGTNESA